MRSKFLCIVLLTNALLVNAANYSFKIINGQEITTLNNFIAHLRLTAFAEYPYLYQGNITEELVYIDGFSKKEHTAIAIVFDDNVPVGMVTGTALINYDEHSKSHIKVFESAGLNPKEYYYFADVIILPEHRGHGLSRKLFSIFEEWVQKYGYKYGCFITESHEQHPLKPNIYISLDGLWQKLGYLKSDLFVIYSWLTLQLDGSTKEQEHKVDFWLREF